MAEKTEDAVELEEIKSDEDDANIIFKHKKIKDLYELAGEIGALGERDSRFERISTLLSDAVDAAIDMDLIKMGN